MGLFTPDFFRSLAFGFAAGAALVLGTLGISNSGPMTSGMVPSASAAPAATQ